MTQVDLDRVVHEPARLGILVTLSNVKEADFSFLVRTLGMTRGNFAAHVGRLEREDLVETEKAFVDGQPRTLYRMTASGRRRLRAYRRDMQAVLAAHPEAPVGSDRIEEETYATRVHDGVLGPRPRRHARLG